MAPYTQLSVWLKYIAASFLVAKTIQFLFQFWPFTPNVMAAGGFTNGYGFKQE